MNTDTIFGDNAVSFSSDQHAPAGIQTAALSDPRAPLSSPLFSIDAAKVVIPAGQAVVHVTVAPGETVELPFGADAKFLGKLGDGNLAIKVGDVTIILEGYADATNDPARPVTVTSADGTVLDIAALLAATDPTIDIETAAGPAGQGGQGGQGAGNTGGIFTFFGTGGKGGEGGSSIGVQDDTSPPQGGTGGAGGVGGLFFGNGGVGGSSGATNAPPETHATLSSGLEDEASIPVHLSGADSDGTVASFVISSIPTGGTLYGDAAQTLPLAVGDTVTAAANAATVYFVPDLNFNGTVSFDYAAVDNTGAKDGTPATATIDVAAVNDAPQHIGTSAVTLNEDSGPTPIPGVSVVDVDAGPFAIQVTLSVSHGVLDVTGSNLTITGAGTGSVTLDGSLADINNALTSLTYRPAANFNGADFLVISANDLGNTGAGGPLTVTDIFSISVNPVNDPPHAVNDAVALSQGSQVAISVLANDTDIDSPLASLTPSIVSAPAHGTVIPQPNGTFIYIHDGTKTTSDSFTYNVNDGTDFSNTATVNITIVPVNALPTAVTDSITVAEGQTATTLISGATSVLTNDTDPDNDLLTALLVTSVQHGTLTLNPDGTFSYQHDGSETTSDSFTYKVNDGTADGNTVQVNIAITPVNDLPVAVNDSYATNEDAPLTIPAPGILGNDSDADGDPLHVSAIVTGPANGSLVLNADGSFTYTPEANYNGADSFVYKANDGAADSNTATVSITVNPVNDAPVNGVPGTLVAFENVATLISGITVSDIDPPQNGLLQTTLIAAHGVLNLGVTTGLVNLTGNGTSSIVFDGTLADSNAALASLTYKSDPGVSGAQTLTLISNDLGGTGTGGTLLDVDTVTILVSPQPPNHAPVANNDQARDLPNGGISTSLMTKEDSVLANDFDLDGDPKTAILVDTVQNGTLTLNPDGTFIYVHNGSNTQTDSFTYQVSDGKELSNLATVSFTIAPPPNHAPVANNDQARDLPNGGISTSLMTKEDSVLANDFDPDGDPKTAVLVDTVQHGTLVLNPDGTFSYTHNGSNTQTDSFTYRVSDGKELSNLATVSFTIAPPPPNQAPVAVNDSIRIGAAGVTTQLVGGSNTVLSNDSDADGNPLQATLVSNVQHGLLFLGANGTFLYANAFDGSTTDSFTYKVSDGMSDSNIATVSITILPPNLFTPTAVNDSIQMYRGETATTLVGAAASVLANDFDMDFFDTLTAVLVGSVAHGTLALNPDGTFSYQNDGTSASSDSFTYQAVDSAGHVSGIATVQINIDTGPTANMDMVITNAGTSAFQIPEWALLYNDVGKNSANLDVTGVGNATGGSAVHTAGSGSQGFVTFTDDPTPGGSFGYTAVEGSITGSTASVSVQNQSGLTVTGGVGVPEILIGSAGNDTLSGGGGSLTKHDLIFGGDGDDTVSFFPFFGSDVIYGGGDNVAIHGGLMAGSGGDTLKSGGNADFSQGYDLHGIETLNVVSDLPLSQITILSAANILAMSDHKITPGGDFSEQIAIYIKADNADDIFLSVSQDGGKWSDTGLLSTDGGKIYVHDTTAGTPGNSENAYVIVSGLVSPIGGVHLNADI